MNEVTICGRLGADPEIKYFESGKQKTTFSVATDGYDAKKKEKVTYWHNIECWDKTADFTAEYFKKGSSVVVQGELRPTEFKEKTYWNVIARSATFSNAFITMCGIVEKVENRFTKENKRIQIIKIVDKDIPIYNYNEKIEIVGGESVTLLCSLGMVDYKPVAKVLKIGSGLSECKNKQIVKFSECEDTDEIPY